MSIYMYIFSNLSSTLNETKVGIWGSLGSSDYVRVCTKSAEGEAFMALRWLLI